MAARKLIEIQAKTDHYSACVKGQFIRLYSEDISFLVKIGYKFRLYCQC